MQTVFLGSLWGSHFCSVRERMFQGEQWANPMRRFDQKGGIPVRGNAKTATKSPFDSSAITRRIVGGVTQVQAESVAWSALGDSAIDEHLMKLAVGSFDAHAKEYLSVTRRREHVREYMQRLQAVKTGLMKRLEKHPLLRDRVSVYHADGSISRVEDTLEPVQRVCVGNLGPSQVPSRTVGDPKRAAWRVNVLVCLEASLEARFRHWSGEAQKQVEDSTPAPCPVFELDRWEGLNISFVSDFRVNILIGKECKSLDYGEFGFMDRRKQIEDSQWQLLRRLAENHGCLETARSSGRNRSALEKNVQRLRKALRERFGLQDDPIPFVKGTGYRVRFGVSLGPTYRY